MSRFWRSSLVLILALSVVGLVTSCNTIGGGGTGNLMMLMTDGPTDDWTEVTVHFLSASLHRQGADSWETFWTANTADPASGKVNLIDLSGISDILNAGTAAAGTYDRLKLVMNTQPSSMTLIPADSTTPIAAENITVVDPSGTGEIKVDLDPDLVVEADKNNIVSIDFDLSHPLSIVNLDGKVVISLKVRHKALPRNLSKIQFARTIGTITAAEGHTDGTAAFKIKNLQGAEIAFNANGNTVYVDVSSGQAATGDFTKFSDPAHINAWSALVASNMNADGSLYARRVWYADTIDKLPQFTPEGLVRRVGDTWLSIQGKKAEEQTSGDHHHRCEWDAETIFVNADTAWTFQGVDMGVTGLDGLRYVSRGFRVETVSVDENVTPKIAKSVNIQFAHIEGIVNEPTLDNFKIGWFWRNRTLVYSAVSGHEFNWWFYGETSPSYSADRQALIDMVGAAQTAHLWVFASAGLTWDASGATKQWVVEDLVLAPMKLHEMTKITEGYKADTSTMVVSTYDCWDWATPVNLTVKLDTTGDLQTVVGSFVWTGATNVVTFTLPVPVAQWASLLVPTVNKVKVWVRPVKEGDTYTWHAYTVIAYQFIR
ncbi:MAG TPA: DUF4382 domain-containing protein [Candidatus Bathyarchaeia archaeon]|nr:DUF4382 domain-containing protein [Candidatus Bathyarchaeia archaeon]